MKTVIFGLLLALGIGAFAEPFKPINPSQERAVAQYPSVLDASSPLGKAVISDINLREDNDPVFADPEGYEKIVRRQAAILNIGPARLPGGEGMALDNRVHEWRLALKANKPKAASTERYYQRKAARDEIAERARTAAAEQALIDLPWRLRAIEQKQRELQNTIDQNRLRR